MKYTFMHMYKCVIVQSIQFKKDYGSKNAFISHKNVKNMNNPYYATLA